jgi:hypothetical protein
VYPSSSKVHKNWDKLDKEIEQDIKKNKVMIDFNPLG